MKERKRIEKSARDLEQRQELCVCRRAHAGTLPVGKGQEASCVFSLPCEHPVHWEKNGDRRSAMLIRILSNILSHPYTHIYAHTQRKLPRLVAKTVSIKLLILLSNWHIDWWWRALRTAKWLLAGLQREKQESFKPSFQDPGLSSLPAPNMWGQT